MQDLHQHIRRLYDIACTVNRQGIDISASADKFGLDYEQQKRRYYRNQLSTTIQELARHQQQIPPAHENAAALISELQETTDPGRIQQLAEQLHHETKRMPRPQQRRRIELRPPREISAEVQADVDEMQRCFRAGCYRSVVILCGRLIEVALHRLYYDTTGMDILEKNPGIGLGKLIAKLKEKEVQLEPGLSEQVHLINQTRIFSVHKKKEAFEPSESQTQAIMLYTTDVLKKIF